MHRVRTQAQSFQLFTLLLLALVFQAGCRHSGAGDIYKRDREVLAETDDFGMLLVSAGISLEALPTGKSVSVADAEQLRLLLSLHLADGSMQRYGPRLAAEILLTEVIAGGQSMPRVILNERFRRFAQLAVLRPDGYLASVSTGSPVQCVGPIQVKDGALRSGSYTVGTFYSPDGKSFTEVPDLSVEQAEAHPRAARSR